MNNINLLELAVKLILLRNDRIRDFASNVSKANTLVYAGQLCNQIGSYKRMASFASLYSPSNDRSKILELCNHGINDCYNELGRLTREAIRDEAIERYANMRRGYRS